VAWRRGAPLAATAEAFVATAREHEPRH